MSSRSMNVSAAATAPAASMAPAVGRIPSLDFMRGVVMVLMAIDHVRVYSGLPAGGLTPGIFFTRWVTHFCAPAFVFFAGTGAFLHGRKLADKRALVRYLVTRGLLLVLLELTVIRFSWTFNFNYRQFVLAGVIWMLGWCMVLMAGLVRLPTRAIGIIGLAIIAFQQVFQFVPRALPQSMRSSVGWIWEFIYPSGLKLPSEGINILYVLVPWSGVMAAGYAFGAITVREPAQRHRICLRIGLSATALFLVAGSLMVFLRPAPANAPPALFRLLNQQKYPASVLFLLMTLGPTIAVLPLVERARGWVAAMLTTFGRVPMFYYLLHIPLIHIAALVVMLLREGSIHSEWYATAPYVWMPEHRWGLPLLYLVFVIVIAILYVPCRWFARVKARHPQSWLRYI
jgi:uncharacterized membrane protein